MACFYGIDFASPAELIANGAGTRDTVEEGHDYDEMVEMVRRSIGADSLGYISIDGMIGATEQPASRLCAACFDGHYPIALPSEHQAGKDVLNGVVDTDSATPTVLDNDNADVLSRP